MYKTFHFFQVAFYLFFAVAIAPHAYADYRSIDGSGNNLTNSDWGQAGIQLLRENSGAHYGDGISTPGGASRPTPRLISNEVFGQSGSILNTSSLTDWTWQWGQFIDHDLDLTDNAMPKEPFNISVPTGDPHFDPAATGTKIIPLNRSQYDPATGTDVSNPRQQVNVLTAWVDGSMVYGSDNARASWLRTGTGGQLKFDATPVGDLMPKNDGTQANAMGMGTQFFVAGDVRANEQVGLTAVHTLFMREHNRLAGMLASENPGWSDEQIYQQSRALVGAEIQSITYNEWLPALLGDAALSPYGGYNDGINPGVRNAFSTAGFRIGHTMLSPTLLRVDNNGNVIPEGNLSLMNSFFNPALTEQVGIDPVVKGLASQLMQQVDAKVIDDVRNFLFGPPGAGGLDLVSLNLQRGRDHGLADYNTARVDFGLSPISSFSEITSSVDLQQILEGLYGDVNNIDFWVGGLAEDHVAGSNFGSLFHAIWLDQFTRLRDADRFWYEINANFSPEVIDLLRRVRLSDIIRLNTGITNIQSDVFHLCDYTSTPNVPEPSTMVLFSLGGIATAFYRRRKKNQG